MPWSATKRDIANFLEHVNISRGHGGIIIKLNDRGQPSGEAFVEVERQDDVVAAIRCHRRYMGSRYVKVYEAGRLRRPDHKLSRTSDVERGGEQ